MRRSQAPSQLKAAPAPATPRPAAAPPKAISTPVAAKSSTPEAASAASASFTIFWAQAGPKKTKSWDNGVLHVKENLTCSVVNDEGKEIGKGRISGKDLEGLVPGKKVNISHYEIEIVSVGAAPPVPVEVCPSPASASVSTPAPSQNIVATTTKHFAVFWCAASTKKHKAKDCGFMTIEHPEGACTLKNASGKELSKTKSKKALEDPSSVTRIGMFEVEIEKEVQANEVVFNSAAADAPAAPVVKAAPAPFKPHAPITPKRKASALFSADDPNALVLYHPRPDEPDNVAVVLDPILKRKLHPHQLEGVKFLYECVMGIREPSVNGCILADEMGLGKTIQTIALLWTLLKQGCDWSAIIVTPSTLVGNWVKEVHKWLKDLKPLYATIATDRKSNSVATGSIRDCIARFGNSPISPVLIVSYEQFRMYCDDISPLRCDLIICDEGHRIKNASSQVTAALNDMDTKRRVILSGTPLQNDLDEFYCMFNFCAPGLLGPLQSFKREFSAPIMASRDPKASPSLKASGEAKSAELAALTAPFMLRRTSALMEHYMPPKQELVLFCSPTPQQQRMYQHLLKSKAIGWLLSGTDGGASATALQFVTYLKKLSNHPRLLLGSEETQDMASDLKEAIAATPLNPATSGKLHVVKSLLRLIRGTTTDRVVLVSNYTQTLDLLSEVCSAENYPFVRLDGSTDNKKRTAVVEQFNNSHRDTFVMLLSARAGAIGLNLIGANRLILFDPDWNPAIDRQAMARVWREGQRKPVFIYRLLSTGTIDEKIYQRQMSKEALGNAILRDDDGGADEARSFSKEELRDIFSFNSDTLSDTHDLLQCACLGGTGKKVAGRVALSKRAAIEIGRMTHHTDMQELNDPMLRQLGIASGVSLVMCRTAKQGEEETDGAADAEADGANDATMTDPKRNEGDEEEEEREEEAEEGVEAEDEEQTEGKLAGKRRRVIDDND